MKKLIILLILITCMKVCGNAQTLTGQAYLQNTVMGLQKGFGLRVQTNKGLGIYPNVSLKVARDKRQIYQELLAEGHDPAEYLAKKKNEQASVAANTLRKVTELWLETQTDITARYARDIKNSLTTHVMPIFLFVTWN